MLQCKRTTANHGIRQFHSWVDQVDRVTQIDQGAAGGGMFEL